MAWNYLLEHKAEVFALVALYVQLPAFAASLADFQNDFSFAARLKTKIKIIAHNATIDLDNAVASLKLKLMGKTSARDFCYFHPAPSYLRDGWSDCKLVHRKLLLLETRLGTLRLARRT